MDCTCGRSRRVTEGARFARGVTRPNEPIRLRGQGGPTLPDSDDILTSEEAARLLRVSERTLERWRVRRRIPYVEYPRQGAWAPIRFRRGDILEWLRRHVVKPNRNGDQAA